MADIPDLPLPTSTPTEWAEVERPLLIQLAGMGWQYMPGDIDLPELTERETAGSNAFFPFARPAASGKLPPSKSSSTPSATSLTALKRTSPGFLCPVNIPPERLR